MTYRNSKKFRAHDRDYRGRKRHYAIDLRKPRLITKEQTSAAAAPKNLT